MPSLPANPQELEHPWKVRRLPAKGWQVPEAFPLECIQRHPIPGSSGQGRRVDVENTRPLDRAVTTRTRRQTDIGRSKSLVCVCSFQTKPLDSPCATSKELAPVSRTCVIKTRTCRRSSAAMATSRPCLRPCRPRTIVVAMINSETIASIAANPGDDRPNVTQPGRCRAPERVKRSDFKAFPIPDFQTVGRVQLLVLHDTHARQRVFCEHAGFERPRIR